LNWANSGPNTNSCQVCFITTALCDLLDGRNVVFVKVIDDMVSRKIENVPMRSNNQSKLVIEITGIMMASNRRGLHTDLLFKLQNVERCKELTGFSCTVSSIIGILFGRYPELW
ncbi:hypothetical protein H4582DRAFT_1813574, partial [Lactarius indigo]